MIELSWLYPACSDLSTKMKQRAYHARLSSVIRLAGYDDQVSLVSRLKLVD